MTDALPLGVSPCLGTYLLFNTIQAWITVITGRKVRHKFIFVHIHIIYIHTNLYPYIPVRPIAHSHSPSNHSLTVTHWRSVYGDPQVISADDSISERVETDTDRVCGDAQGSHTGPSLPQRPFPGETA